MLNPKSEDSRKQIGIYRMEALVSLRPYSWLSLNTWSGRLGSRYQRSAAAVIIIKTFCPGRQPPRLLWRAPTSAAAPVWDRKADKSRSAC